MRNLISLYTLKAVLFKMASKMTVALILPWRTRSLLLLIWSVNNIGYGICHEKIEHVRTFIMFKTASFALLGPILDAILNISTFPLFDFVTFSLYESLRHILLKSVGKTLLCRSSHDLQPLTYYGGHLGRHLENNLFSIVGFRGFLLCYLWSQILQKSVGKTLLFLTANNI